MCSKGHPSREFTIIQVSHIPAKEGLELTKAALELEDLRNVEEKKLEGKLGFLNRKKRIAGSVCVWFLQPVNPVLFPTEIFIIVIVFLYFNLITINLRALITLAVITNTGHQIVS